MPKRGMLPEPPLRSDEHVSQEESEALREAARLVSLGRHDEAVSMVRNLAVEGSSRAQVYLGWMFLSGDAGDQDRDAALRWLQKAAESGDPVGEYYFGCTVFHVVDREEGGRWIRRAAAQDYAAALYWEGRLRESGIGMERDLGRAHSSMSRAAELGHPFAMMWLASRGVRGHEGISGFIKALLILPKIPGLARKMHEDESLDPNMLNL